MRRVIERIWRQGILSTFLTGLFAILPLVITIAILAWVAKYLHALLGPEGLLGMALSSLGLQLVSNALAAWTIGLVVVLTGIWCLGLLMKSVARQRIERASNAVVGRIPIVKSVYSTAAQLVAMLRKEEQTELTSMSVVFCRFGQEHGAGVLCLLASPQIHNFGQRDYHLVFTPTSPIPMTGGLLFVPVDAVQKVDMSVEQLMRLYLSMGILTSQVMPAQHLLPQPA